MTLSIEHLLDLLDELPKGQEFDYVKPGKNKAKLVSVDRTTNRVDMARVVVETKKETSSTLNEENLKTIVNSVVENKPFSIDKIFNNGGNTRSVWEAILANTSEFYKCMVGRNKNLVWIPTMKKQVGEITEISINSIPNYDKDNHLSSASIRKEFEYYLSDCVKSSRNTNNVLGTLGDTAVQSYLSMLDKRDDGSIELFDYNPKKWSHISDIYQIIDPNQAEQIFNELLNDQDFIERDKNHNSGWRPGALNLYILFLRARKYFSKNAMKIKPIIANLSINKILPYLTALRTKPFMLLAGISGTGKSRIVRELAKACWQEGDEEFGKNNPRNFCMLQVKPNWHDSAELLGYVSRISGKSEFVPGDFLKFVVNAWEEPDVPYFLCLDEMNLAPVEQYFAEYLSVIESRKLIDGVITTDPLLKKPYEKKEYDLSVKYGEDMDWFQQLVIQLTSNDVLKKQFYQHGISIPQNLFVVGTVNMDETTFSFSRKVLDRAMTLEMNEVDLYGGLTDEGSEIGYIGNCIIGTAAEGKDVYAENKELCDLVLTYLEKMNAVLEGTPFKIAYRTRNEFLLYVVNRQLLDKDSQLWQTLDEMTSMKILSRIEGDSDRAKKPLEALQQLVETHITKVIPESKDDTPKPKSISATKIEEMLKKLHDTSFTSYWT